MITCKQVATLLTSGEIESRACTLLHIVLKRRVVAPRKTASPRHHLERGGTSSREVKCVSVWFIVSVIGWIPAHLIGQRIERHDPSL